MKKNFVLLLSTMLFCGLTLTCSDNPASRIYQYTCPVAYNDGLEVSAADSVGINPDILENMVGEIRSGLYGEIHGVLIIKNEKLVFEEYFNGFHKDDLHELASVSKSFCSILTGIAIEKQFINGVDDSIRPYLPEYDHIDWSEKSGITIHHLLSMSAGLNWDEWTARYDDPENVFVNMINSPDPVFYVLNRPLANEPGTTFTYNTGLPIIMGKIISNASGMSLDEFATEYLFTPLGIDSHLWYTYGNNTNSIGSSLRITPRDMAKFGLLCLNHGIWNGQQIVSEEWLATATTSRFSPWNGTYYGYYWWKVPFYRDGQRIEEYGAHGRAGQYIFILPELDIVAVFTSWNDNELYDEPLTIMQDYILPSVE